MIPVLLHYLSRTVQYRALKISSVEIGGAVANSDLFDLLFVASRELAAVLRSVIGPCGEKGDHAVLVLFNLVGKVSL